MEYCKNCGGKLSANTAFCPKCGSGTAAAAVQAEELSTRTAKPFLSFKVKAMLITLAVFIAAAAGTHFYISSQMKPSAAASKFERAVYAGDSKTVADMVNNGQYQVKLSQDQAAEYISFLTKDQDFQELAKKLDEQVYQIASFQRIDPVADANGNKLFRLAQGPKKWGIYTEYHIEFFPIEVLASSSLDKTELYLNEKALNKFAAINDEQSLGFFMPGAYTLTGKIKGEYASLKSEKKLSFTDASENKLHAALEMNGSYISFNSNDSEGILYINGKSTGDTISSASSVGPVPLDGSVTAYAVRQVNGKEQKSDMVKIDSDYMDLSFDDSVLQESEPADITGSPSYGTDTDYETLPSEEELKSFMDNFYTASTQAINNRDFSIVSDMYTLGGKSYNEMQTYIPSLEKKGITESYNGFELIGCEAAPEGYYVQTKDSFTIYYRDGSSKDKTFHSKFLVKMIDGSFKVDSLLSTKEI